MEFGEFCKIFPGAGIGSGQAAVDPGRQVMAGSTISYSLYRNQFCNLCFLLIPDIR